MSDAHAGPGPDARSNATLETLRVERLRGVVTITLDRPHRKNAVNGVMWDELEATFRHIGSSAQDRVVVITGAGGAFCSGADLSPESGGAPGLSGMRHIGDVCLALHNLPQPTIAKVNGIAAGAGLNMALGCDLTIASTEARFSEIFSRRGLSVDFGGSWVLPRLVGLHRAKQLVLLADIIDATEAERLGLVNKVVPPEDLDDAVADWARRLAEGPPIALAQSKRMLDNSFAVSLEQAVDDEGRAQTVNFGTSDTAEAILAFLEKRRAHFEGR
ncbi:MAG: enoyl-CoA hydratase-related protein [Actinomycetota bacterium]|nr:enoyl-CoA hydratase-related protein [Actinomycetota bacterium]